MKVSYGLEPGDHPSFIEAPIHDPSGPVEMGHVACSADSCLVCTVHTSDGKRGRDLATVRIGEMG